VIGGVISVALLMGSIYFNLDPSDHRNRIAGMAVSEQTEPAPPSRAPLPIHIPTTPPPSPRTHARTHARTHSTPACAHCEHAHITLAALARHDRSVRLMLSIHIIPEPPVATVIGD
jgi:hypothetical protein